MPINPPIQRNSDTRSAAADPDAVDVRTETGQSCPDGLDRELDEAPDRDIDSADFSALWLFASEDEESRRCQHLRPSATGSSPRGDHVGARFTYRRSRLRSSDFTIL